MLELFRGPPGRMSRTEFYSLVGNLAHQSESFHGVHSDLADHIVPLIENGGTGLAGFMRVLCLHALQNQLLAQLLFEPTAESVETVC